MLVRKIPLIVAMVAALGAVSMPVAGAQAPSDAQFLVKPGPGASTSPEGGYFVVKSRPGTLLHESVVLRNDSDRPLRLRLGAVDTVTGPLGGTSYELPADEVDLTGSWISLGKTEVSLPPGGVQEVPFEIRIPDTATSGQHLAGITAYVPNEEEDAAVAAGEAGAVVTVQTRQVITVLVELPGPSAPGLLVSGVDTDARTDGVYLEVDISNEGTALTAAEGTITMPEHGFTTSFDIGPFVPGTAISYPIEWKASPEEGRYPVEVEIAYDGGTARWNGSFVIGEGVTAQLAQQRGSTGWSPAHIAIAIGLLLLMGSGGMAIRRRRRHSPRQLRGRPISRPVAARVAPISRPVAARVAPISRPVAARVAPVARPRYPVSGPPPPPPPPVTAAAR